MKACNAPAVAGHALCRHSRPRENTPWAARRKSARVHLHFHRPAVGVFLHRHGLDRVEQRQIGHVGRNALVVHRAARIDHDQRPNTLGRFQADLDVVTGIEMFNKLLDEGRAGENVGILLRGLEKNDIERGMVLAAPGTCKPHKKFKGAVYVLTKEEGGRHKPFFTGTVLSSTSVQRT